MKDFRLHTIRSIKADCITIIMELDGKVAQAPMTLSAMEEIDKKGFMHHIAKTLAELFRVINEGDNSYEESSLIERLVSYSKEK